MLSLLDELISAHLDVLIEKVAAEDLLAITIVQDVRGHEQQTKCSLGNELHVLVVEENVVVVEEQELYKGYVKISKVLLQRLMRRSYISCSMGSQHTNRSCHRPIQLKYYQL